MTDLKQYIIEVQDFPEPGVSFKDMSYLLANKFGDTIDALANLFSKIEINDINYFVGIDARGFILAAALAERFNKGVVMIRKANKLPPPVISKQYSLEYGSNTLEIKPGTGRVVIIDDVLATGGSLKAAAKLCTKAGYTLLDIATLIDLRFLNNFEWYGLRVKSVIQYE